MTKAFGHRGLRVWQEAMDLVTEIYRLAKAFSKEELQPLALTRQRIQGLFRVLAALMKKLDED